MPDLTSVNGVVTPTAEARIPATDRGFLYGDAAYEVIRVYGGRPFALAEHLERLLITCRGMRLAAAPSARDLEAACRSLVAAAGLAEAALYVHVSRGADGQGSSLADYTRPTVVIRCERPPQVPAAWRTDGIALITVGDQRWLGRHLKTVNLLPRVLASEAAREAGAVEALWVDPEDGVREGLSSNVFAWFGDVLATPPLSGQILAGITRSVILGLAASRGTPVREDPLPVSRITAADEVFISSTTREIIPVVRIDRAVIGAGRPGPRTAAMLDLYRGFVRSCP